MSENIEKELSEIKKLLVLLCILEGASTDGVAKALGVHATTIQRMIPLKELKKQTK